MEIKKISGIYALVNKVNGKIYVGQSVDIANRLSVHRYSPSRSEKKSYAIYNAINKYGWNNFHKIVLYYCDIDISKTEEVKRILTEKENFWINYFKNCRESYNIRHAADSNFGIKHSSATKDKCRKRMLGNKYSLGSKMSEENKQKLIERMSKYKHSDESKKKISSALKGRIFSEETKKKMSAKARGKFISDYTKNKISKTLSGRPQSAEHIKKRLAAVGRTKSGRFMKKAEM